MKKIISVVICVVILLLVLCGCSGENVTNSKLNDNLTAATDASVNVIENQPAPTDLDYSLERYNLIRRAYWVNGQREKANSLPCSVDKPLGYIVLFSDSGAVVGNFVVDGKVSSLGSYLFPAYVDKTSGGHTVGDAYFSEFNGESVASIFSVEIPGIDGAYGSNVSGIFFFTVDGKYVEWTGDFLYSDIPFDVGTPVLQCEGVN